MKKLASLMLAALILLSAVNVMAGDCDGTQKQEGEITQTQTKGSK